MQAANRKTRVLAVLGPTNTGKTHFAMERMLGYSSGMIGFPLRLLARENYDRAVRIKGTGQVALITGEEKIVPPHARYFLCTAESMPLDRRVAFLALDEVQMCADTERGHVFTERLLDARGEDETMFMGADTIRPLMRRLVPEAEVVTRPRFSTLAYIGARKLTRLAPRSVVVAFSAADVYGLAELVRRQRGGAAVVLGALSPRTRNAQVAMYQAGEVDYLVATDAIGMGLNMDVDHVAFAATRKFDGRNPRALAPAELAQIAGRAGRHMNAGTFGTTADIGPLEPTTVERIETHRFDPLPAIFWRNPGLRFTSLAALKSSLVQRPAVPGLVRAREADDEVALMTLAKDPEVAAIAAHPEAVRLLWEVCGVPDFRKVMSDAHARLLKRIYIHLTGSSGRLPTDWMAAQVERLDRSDGDIEVLIHRIANIRTWTYVSFQGGWLADAGHWQERTRMVEDRLSDALHQRLAQRFVDRRTAVLVRSMKRAGPLRAEVETDGAVAVEGHFVGRLDGLRFVPDEVESGTAAARAVAGAAARALGREIVLRVKRLEADDDTAFALGADGALLWRGSVVARLRAGGDVLSPGLALLAADGLESTLRERLAHRLQRWLADHVAERLRPLLAARAAPLKGAARGIAFQLGQSLGSVPRREVERQVRALTRAERRALAQLGVRIGRESVYVPLLLKPAAVEVRALLWSIHGSRRGPTPAPGRVSVARVEGVPADFYEACGYRPLGPVAVRIDILERLAARARTLASRGAFGPEAELLSLAGCSAADLAAVLVRLGYWTEGQGEDLRFHLAPGPTTRPAARRRMPSRQDSPFAKLRQLKVR